MNILKQENTICERYCLMAVSSVISNGESIVSPGDLFDITEATYHDYLYKSDLDRYSLQTCKDDEVHNIKVKPVKVVSVITRYIIEDD